MRHNVDGRKFGRNTSHRKAMFRNLANSVIDKEWVITSVEKAKETRRVIDRLITLGKSEGVHARRIAFSRTRDESTVKKLFTTLAERYKSRMGGYTRILKISDLRWGDAAQMSLLELVDRPQMDRKRKLKAEVASKVAKDASEGAAQEGAITESKESAPKDTFGRFRRMFSSKSKAGTQGGKAHQARRGGAARKTPAAGGGSSKSGGSS
jgi:large subunit ribosomal protein L17